MNKVELEAKVDSLTDQINFYRMIYEAVRICKCFFCCSWYQSLERKGCFRVSFT
jgi:hypothetical protein